MQVNYQYPSASMCIQEANKVVLGLSPDLSRAEKVSFKGTLKHPLIYRDAMLMLREIVISDMSRKKKERVEFYAWLEDEIERRVLLHQEYMPGVRDALKRQMDSLIEEIGKIDSNIAKLSKVKQDLNKEIEKYDIWRDYYRLERAFWTFIRNRDAALWWVLDPVITVHPDQVTFEAFSLDESTYGCLSVQRDEFEIEGIPQLGTTNIDFSAKLAREMERFRTYNEVELSINPEGFTVESGIMPEYIEKKIDLPETWIKGFNQVSAAASLGGIDIDLTPTDMYDICSFLKGRKAHKSPRDMRWILEPGKRIRVIFEPWGTEIELHSIYSGSKKRIERIWGRRRWLVVEKVIPIAKKFTIRLLGFGMPQFIVADLGTMQMTIGFTSWSANDWVRGTAFNILGGFIGEGNYNEVYNLLKEKRHLTMEEINTALDSYSDDKNRAGIGMLLRKGEAYYDLVTDQFRFRQLTNEPIPRELYQVTDLERSVDAALRQELDDFQLTANEKQEIIVKNIYDEIRKTKVNTEIKLDADRQISKVNCTCRPFKKGPRNISAPCSHILALYITSSDFLYLQLEPNNNYSIDQLEDMR